MASGQELARENAARFTAWVAEREARGDYLDYVRRGKLHRSDVATELGFGRSAFAQNPAIKELAEELDKRWGSQKPVTPKTAA